MTFHRFLLGLKSLGRLIEVFRCMSQSRAPLLETLAYLQLRTIDYPYNFELKNGVRLTLSRWEDLTTAWVVFYGNEYALKVSDRVIVDCGANVGAFSLLCAASLPEAKIIAVEPFPATYQQLCREIESNGHSDRIEPINAAVVGIPGEVMMDDREEIASHSRKIGGQNGIPVQGLSLEMIFDRLGSAEIDLLKVDIEGAEFDLFRETSPQVLQRCKRIGMEYHGNGNREELFNQIERAGFRQGRYPKKGSCGVVEFIRK